MPTVNFSVPEDIKNAPRMIEEQFRAAREEGRP